MNNIHDLFEKAKTGDTDAFSTIYQEYYSPVFKYLYYRTQNKELSEDLAQDVFVKTLASVSTFQITDKSPLAYLYTIARNTLIDWRRKKKTISLSDEELIDVVSENEPSPEDAFIVATNKDLVRECLAQLNDDQREIVSLKFLDELSNKEIAEITGKREDAIRQIQVRGLRALAKLLEEKKYEQE
jgi:RNA polymerase sigma-70 factor (ECF subfamily)